jgi:hypothetical protein
MLKILPPRLKGAAGPNPDSKEDDEEPGTELVPIPALPEVMSPHSSAFSNRHLVFKVSGSSPRTTRIYRRSECRGRKFSACLVLI